MFFIKSGRGLEDILSLLPGGGGDLDFVWQHLHAGGYRHF
jgi:hypothetical protein